MPHESVPVRRAAFAAAASSALVEQVGSGFDRLPERRGWTDRAVWYQRPGELLAVVGDHEESATDRVLAHALFHAGDRAVTLVLSENWAYPTRFRQPWLTPNIKVWTHTNGVADFAPPLAREATRDAVVGHPAEKPHRLPPAGAEWVRRLTEWATANPGLADAHTSSMRGWSHDGQRVLTIGGRRTIAIKAGVDATKDKALSVKVTGPMTSSEFDAITTRVERGMADAKAKTYGRFEEHHLQVQLRGHPGTLRLEHPLLREVPAWRPAGGSGGGERGRGFVDLAGLDSAGDIVLVETKLGQDEMLVFQGLDYWIWATSPKNHHWLRERLYAADDARIRLLYAVAGKGASKPRLGRYELSHLDLLDPEIPWRVALLDDWDKAHAPASVVTEPRTKPD